MAPFYKTGFFSEPTSFVIAFLIGIGFGFWLERAGFGNARVLAAQFYFKKMVVLQVMFTAIITAMIGLLLFSLFGWIDLELVYINPTFIWPQIVGGLILGAGMVVSGFCPGTSIVSCATGRIDAYFYLGGTLFGMFLFGEFYPLIEGFHKSGAMGRMTLDNWMNISLGLVGFLVIVMAIFMFWGGEQLEKKSGEKEVVQ